MPAKKSPPRKRMKKVNRLKNAGTNTNFGGSEIFNQDTVLDPTQLLFSVVLGGVAGCMDHTYCEDFGAIFGTTLLFLQLLDHARVIKMPWKSNQHVVEKYQRSTMMESVNWLDRPSVARFVSREVKVFCANNVYTLTGFSLGFALSKGILMKCKHVRRME